MRTTAILLGLLLVLSLQAPAAAETFLLKSGARIYGVEEKHPRGEPSDEWMTVRTSYGRVSFKKADLKRKLTKGQERTTLYIEEAMVTSVEGKAFKSEDGGKSWKPIPWSTAGKETVALEEFPPRVRAGEWVKTHAKSSVDLDVGWGVVRLDTDTELHLAKFKGATLTLTRGRMGARLEELPKGKRFKVETPETTMGVEGTTFLVETQDATRIAVQSGSVLGKAGRVGAGQAQVVSPSGEVRVTPLLAGDQAFFSLLEKAIALPRINWVPVPGGKHVMKAEPAETPERPHGTFEVLPFLLGRYEVTLAEYGVFSSWLAAHGDQALWPQGRPEENIEYRCSPELPLMGWPEMKTLNDPDLCAIGVWSRAAQAFCRWIGGRLPTEIEWEFAACGAGLGEIQLSRPEDYFRNGWLAENSGREAGSLGIPRNEQGETDWGAGVRIMRERGCRPHRIGMKAPSTLGFYDLLGNAQEWVIDELSPAQPLPDQGPSEVSFTKGGGCLTVGWYKFGQNWGWFARRLVGAHPGIRVARDLPR